MGIEISSACTVALLSIKLSHRREHLLRDSYGAETKLQWVQLQAFTAEPVPECDDHRAESNSLHGFYLSR
jgi:hypothetical protein